jgi:hypothetical protein
MVCVLPAIPDKIEMKNPQHCCGNPDKGKKNFEQTQRLLLYKI